MIWTGLFALGCVGVLLPLIRRSFGGSVGSFRKKWFRSAFSTNAVIARIQERWSSWEQTVSISGVRGSLELVCGVALVCSIGGTWGTLYGMTMMTDRFAPGMPTFSPWWISLIIGIVFGSLPFAYVAMRAQRVRHRIALAFIQLVQTLIGHYRFDQTVMEWISRSGESMPAIVQPEWRRLEMQTVLYSSIEDALYEFAQRIGNGWSEDVVELLIMRHKYGHDIGPALQKLMIDLQIAQQQEEKRRATMTVYRIGTVMMIGFAVFSVCFNILAESRHYVYYFVHATGKTVIGTSIAVLAVAAFLVLRSGKRSF